jgi:hypothetical protein
LDNATSSLSNNQPQIKTYGKKTDIMFTDEDGFGQMQGTKKKKKKKKKRSEVASTDHLELREYLPNIGEA